MRSPHPDPLPEVEGVPTTFPLKGEVAAECLQALQIVRAGKHIHVRQRGAHGAGYGAIASVAEKRIQPHDAGGTAFYFLHLSAKHAGVARVKAITPDQHDCVPIDNS